MGRLRTTNLEDGTKRCPLCKEWKSLGDFAYYSGRRYGYCRPCAAVKMQEWRKKTREARSEKARTEYWSNPAEGALKARLAKYKLSRSEYDALLSKQRGLCAICGSDGQLHVDHNHITGQVRGLLCRTCNLGLGYFDDDIARMRTAVAYLQ